MSLRRVEPVPFLTVLVLSAVGGFLAAGTLARRFLNTWCP
jgi:hypothetical protein